VAAGVRVRVLHAPVEIAGQLALAAEGLRRAGVHATAYCEPHPFACGAGPDAVPAVGSPARYLRETARLVARHDVVHFHFATSFLHERRRFADARLIRRLGRRVLVTFHGSEIRRPSVEAARNPHYVPFAGEDDARAQRRLRRWSAITGGHAVLLDPALDEHVRPFFAHVHQHRLAVDTARVSPRPPSPAATRPRLVHSPTERAGKGTRFVREAVDALRARGVAFDYDEVSGVPQSEALARYARADLIVDQLCVGASGAFALEAMSLAKPVVAHVLAEVRARQPGGFPVVQADPRTLAAVLEEWLADGERRRAHGLASRAYVEREHDVGVAGRRLADLYAELGR